MGDNSQLDLQAFSYARKKDLSIFLLIESQEDEWDDDLLADVI